MTLLQYVYISKCVHISLWTHMTNHLKRDRNLTKIFVTSYSWQFLGFIQSKCSILCHDCSIWCIFWPLIFSIEEVIIFSLCIALTATVARLNRNTQHFSTILAQRNRYSLLQCLNACETINFIIQLQDAENVFFKTVKLFFFSFSISLLFLICSTRPSREHPWALFFIFFYFFIESHKHWIHTGSEEME